MGAEDRSHSRPAPGFTGEGAARVSDEITDTEEVCHLLPLCQTPHSRDDLRRQPAIPIVGQNVKPSPA